MGVKCPLVPSHIRTLSDYFALFGQYFVQEGPFWYRGHSDVGWTLMPTALRYEADGARTKALGLIAEFRRIAEIKQSRPPAPNDELGWTQVAQHYGIPTRLLDWTESPMVALYFACTDHQSDGLVFVLDPISLNRLSDAKAPRILDARIDEKTITNYLRGNSRKGKPPAIAINPVWNSERIMLQKGAFTVHSDGPLAPNTPTLAAVPIPREAKPTLQTELERVGIDEMTIFPELEHACRHLRRRAGLVA
jgi:hypothetical protein